MGPPKIRCSHPIWFDVIWRQWRWLKSQWCLRGGRCWFGSRLKFWSLNSNSIERRFCLVTIECCAIKINACGFMCGAPSGIKCDVIGCHRPGDHGCRHTLHHIGLLWVTRCGRFHGQWRNGGGWILRQLSVEVFGSSICVNQLIHGYHRYQMLGFLAVVPIQKVPGHHRGSSRHRASCSGHFLATLRYLPC